MALVLQEGRNLKAIGPQIDLWNKIGLQNVREVRAGGNVSKG